MLLVMGIMSSNPDKKDDAIDGALLRAWDKMKQEQGAMLSACGPGDAPKYGIFRCHIIPHMANTGLDPGVLLEPTSLNSGGPPKPLSIG